MHPPEFGGQKNTREDATGMDAEATGGEVGVAVLVGADCAVEDVVFFDAHGQELLAVAYRQVNVPLAIFLAYFFHIETCCLKLVVDFLSHLKTVEADAGTYLGDDVLRMRSVDISHCPNGLLNDAGHRASPTGMNGCDGSLLWVVEQHGDTVSRAHTDTHALQVGHQGIGTL